MRDLLRPIDGSGNERLRELSLRTRAFKRLFAAWEMIHFIWMEKALYLRDDTIQHLRSLKAEDGDELVPYVVQTIAAYDSIRSVVVELGNILSPWITPYFANHTALHFYFAQGGKGLVMTAGNNQALYLLTSLITI